MQSDAPQAMNPKIAASGIAGAASIILVWVVQTFTGVDVPTEIGMALTTVISGLAGYFKKS